MFMSARILESGGDSSEYAVIELSLIFVETCCYEFYFQTFRLQRYRDEGDYTPTVHWTTQIAHRVDAPPDSQRYNVKMQWLPPNPSKALLQTAISVLKGTLDSG